MYGNSGLVFEHSFDSDSTCSYLVLKLNSDIKLLNHQTEIICQNPNPAFVPFHIRREDENTSIYYNITSKISLSQYLERKKLSKKELLDLLKGITKNLMLHTNYLLDLSGFEINLNFIYINPATAEVSLVYVPASFNRDAIRAYIDFLKDLVVNSASVDDSAGDNYLQRILNFLKSDSFSLNDFNRLIVNLRNSEGSYEQAAKATHEYREKAISGEAAVNVSIPDGRRNRNEASERVAERKNILNIVLLQLLIIMAAAIACLIMMSQAMGDMVSIGGVLLIAAALDILAMKRIAGKESKPAAAEDDRRQEMINSRRHIAQKEAKRSVSCHDTIQKPERSHSIGRYQAVSQAPDVLKACDTIMISEVPKDCHPHLESIGADTFERVIINKDKFIIGRLGSMVDYVLQGSTVGKLHAEIRENKGVYYIKDLNSKNGTYVNDVRIPSNKEFEIKKNDRIRFSSFEYVFRQQEAL